MHFLSCVCSVAMLSSSSSRSRGFNMKCYMFGFLFKNLPASVDARRQSAPTLRHTSRWSLKCENLKTQVFIYRFKSDKTPASPPPLPPAVPPPPPRTQMAEMLRHRDAEISLSGGPGGPHRLALPAAASPRPLPDRLRKRSPRPARRDSEFLISDSDPSAQALGGQP